MFLNIYVMWKDLVKSNTFTKKYRHILDWFSEKASVILMKTDRFQRFMGLPSRQLHVQS